MARDETAPVDPESTAASSTDPSQTLPAPTPPGDGGVDDDGEHSYWLRDGVTPYRADPKGIHSFEVFSHPEDGWMRQYMVDPDKMWPSSAGEIAGMVGGRQRLNEPTKGTAPLTPDPEDSFAPEGPPDYMAEADSTEDAPPPGPADDAPSDETDQQDPDLPPGAMNEQQIRDAGLAVDVPFEAPMPVALTYKDTGQQAWTPPPGFRQGLPPLDLEGVESGSGSNSSGGESGS